MEEGEGQGLSRWVWGVQQWADEKAWTIEGHGTECQKYPEQVGVDCLVGGGFELRGLAGAGRTAQRRRVCFEGDNGGQWGERFD